MDTSGDGRIEYYGNVLASLCILYANPAATEFRAFVERTETEIWHLFKSIDRDSNGRLDKDELQLAFEKAGLAIDNSRLNNFFDKIDTNHDGTITFDEWRFVQSSFSTKWLPMTVIENSCCSSQ